MSETIEVRTKKGDTLCVHRDDEGKYWTEAEAIGKGSMEVTLLASYDGTSMMLSKDGHTIFPVEALLGWAREEHDDEAVKMLESARDNDFEPWFQDAKEAKDAIS